MPLHVVQVALYSIASFLVGGAIAWRVLGRTRSGYSRKLAQELTDSVHARCSAYRNLEGRIDAVVAEFDRCEAELQNELSGSAPLDEPQPLEEFAELAEPLEAAEVQEAGGVEALAWMDSCSAPEGGEAAFVGVPASEAPVAEAFAPAAFEPEMPVAEETANVVDQFAQKLQILQREKTTELEQQRGRVDRIEGRMQSLESAILELAKREPPASAAKSEGTEWARPLEDLLERMLRSEGALEAWKAQHEAWSRERLALLESLRELAAGMAKGMLRNPEAEAAATSLRARAEELARDAAKLQASITKREMEAPRPTVAPKAGDARAAPPAPVEPAPQAPPAQPFESAVPEPAAAASAEAEPPPMPVDQAPSLVDPAGALELPAGEGTQVGQLMRSLEIAKSDAEKYRRKLHEQGLQFSAAYAMLDRIRPFVQALESEFAAQARGGEKKS